MVLKIGQGHIDCEPSQAWPQFWTLFLDHDHRGRRSAREMVNFHDHDYDCRVLELDIC